MSKLMILTTALMVMGCLYADEENQLPDFEPGDSPIHLSYHLETMPSIAAPKETMNAAEIALADENDD